VSYFKSTYADDIQPILSDWTINSRSGKSVSDLQLSLANRATQNLWNKKAWSNLVLLVSLSLDSNGAYAIDTNLSDFGRIVDIADYSDNVPTQWYEEGNDETFGYKMTNAFTKAAGQSRVMTFNNPSVISLKMRYVQTLEKFTGSGTEYSYFPANLVILEAQKINTSSKGNPKQHQLFVQEYNDAYNDYKNTTQWVNANTRPVMRDHYGSKVTPQTFSLAGGNPGRRNNTDSNKTLRFNR